MPLERPETETAASPKSEKLALPEKSAKSLALNDTLPICP